MRFIDKDDLIAKLYATAQSKGFIQKALKHTTPEKIINYLSVCVNYCETQMQITGILNLPLVTLRNNAKRYKDQSSGKITHVWYMGQDHIKFFDEEKKGNGSDKKITTGMVNIIYKDILMSHEQTTAPQQQVTNVNSILGHGTVDVPVKLNRTRIAEAIKNEHYFSGINSKGDKKTVELNRAEVAQLKWLLKNMDEDDILYQTFEQKSTGRLYNQNGSHTLLTVTKKVRNIAAPQRMLIDVNSACFSVFIGIYNKVQKESGFFRPLTHVETYVNNPKQLRLKIVKRICDAHYQDDNKWRQPPVIDDKCTEYKMVKEAFTAMGFGAKTPKPTATGYNPCYWKTSSGKWETDSLNGILKKKTEYFLSDPFVVEFIKELNVLNEVISAKYESNDEHELYPGVIINRNRKKQQQLSLIYQTIERQILDRMYEVIPSGQVMALLHDGIMVKTTDDALYTRKIIEDNINDKLVILFADGTHMKIDNRITVSVEKMNNEYLNTSTENITQTQQLANAHNDHMEEELHRAASTEYAPAINAGAPDINMREVKNRPPQSLATVRQLVKKIEEIKEPEEKITAATMMNMYKPHKKKEWDEAAWAKKNAAIKGTK